MYLFCGIWAVAAALSEVLWQLQEVPGIPIWETLWALQLVSPQLRCRVYHFRKLNDAVKLSLLQTQRKVPTVCQRVVRKRFHRSHTGFQRFPAKVFSFSTLNPLNLEGCFWALYWMSLQQVVPQKEQPCQQWAKTQNQKSPLESVRCLWTWLGNSART